MSALEKQQLYSMVSGKTLSDGIEGDWESDNYEESEGSQFLVEMYRRPVNGYF